MPPSGETTLDMKRSALKRTKGLHSVGSGDHQKAVHALDRALSKLVRSHFRNQCATCIHPHAEYDCGHFVKRERMATRFHPFNVFPQGTKENRFEGGKEWEFGRAIDAMHGSGAAQFLKELSRPIHKWDTLELQTLADAARRGWRVYEQTYFMLRPGHRRSGLGAKAA
jgi:hypothetical protein